MGFSQDTAACCVCGGIYQLESHHVIPRSRGGTDGPQIWLCADHHRMVTDETWFIDYEEGQRIRVIDIQTGVVLKERIFDDTFDQGQFLDLARKHTQLSTDLVLHVRYLDDDGLESLYAQAEALGKRSWVIMAYVVEEAWRRFPKIHTQKDALTAIGSRFGASASNVRKLLKVADFFQTHDVDEFQLEDKSFYTVALDEGGQQEAVNWLAHAQEQKALTGGRYSVADLRRDIHREHRGEDGDGFPIGLKVKKVNAYQWLASYKRVASLGASCTDALNGWKRMNKEQEPLVGG